MSDSFSLIARAKVNLDLRITGRRSDGYHTLDSIVVFPDFGDELTFVPDMHLQLDVVGDFSSQAGGPADNLVLRAARALAAHGGVKPQARVQLVKKIPVAAGLGGGSADAAAALIGLNRLWRLNASEADLGSLAIQLGADVPACLASCPLRMRGIGEDLARIPAMDLRFRMLLVNCGEASATRDVFRVFAGVDRDERTIDRRALRTAAPEHFLGMLIANGNDLAAPAMRIAPGIADTLAALRDCAGLLHAGVSGSGATCFGLFGDEAAAHRAGAQVKLARPEWWAQGCSVAI